MSDPLKASAEVNGSEPFAEARGSATVVGVRVLVTRKSYTYTYYGETVGESKQLQYQTQDGQWHDVPEVVVVESPNSKLTNPAAE